MKISVGTPLLTIRNCDLECYTVESFEVLRDGICSFKLKEARGTIIEATGERVFQLWDSPYSLKVDLKLGDEDITFYTPNVVDDYYENEFAREMFLEDLTCAIEKKYHVNENCFLKCSCKNGIPLTLYIHRAFPMKYVNYVKPVMFVISGKSGTLQIVEKEVRGILCSPDEDGNIYYTDGTRTCINSVFYEAFPDRDSALVMLSAMQRYLDFFGFSTDTINFFDGEVDNYIVRKGLEEELKEFKFFD